MFKTLSMGRIKMFQVKLHGINSLAITIINKCKFTNFER